MTTSPSFIRNEGRHGKLMKFSTALVSGFQHGNIIITGYTESLGSSGSSSFPQLALPGGYSQTWNTVFGVRAAAFVTKFSSTGVLTWSFFYAGYNWDYGYGKTPRKGPAR